MKSKILTVLLAAVIAICLWGYVITVERPESEKSFYQVAVVLDGENVLQDRGLMIISGEDATVTLTLAGRRSDLKNLKSSDMAAVVDLTRITEPGTHNLSYKPSIPGNVDAIKRTPDTVTLTVVEWTSKEIPVNLTYEGQVHEDYAEDRQSTTLNHDSVTVKGPKDIINQIEQAKVTIDLNDRTETFAEWFIYALCDVDGKPIEDVSTVTTDHGEIQVSMSIHQRKTVNLVYNVIDGGGLTAADVVFEASSGSITVAGSPAALVNLNEINLGTIDLGQLSQDTEKKFAVKLPEGIRNLSDVNEVTIKVNLPEMEERTYSISQIRMENVPEGLDAQLIDELLDVVIRGRKPILDRITEDHITAVVDLEGQVAGDVYLPVVIEIDGYGEVQNVGSVGQPVVQVELSEINTENKVEPAA